MNSALETIVRLLEGEICKQSQSAIADYGCPDESSLMGTKDGLLTLALTLVRTVKNYERSLSVGALEGSEKGAESSQPDEYWCHEANAYWSGAIKKAFYHQISLRRKLSAGGVKYICTNVPAHLSPPRKGKRATQALLT